MQIPIPGYSIVSTLNQGAWATVYLALDKNPGRELALKVIPVDKLQGFDAEVLARERALFRRLVHPNIVPILDVGIHADHYYLASLYLPGRSLNHKRFELDLLARLRVVIDIAYALDFAGDQGYLHGAVNLDNILVHAQDGRAILLGFGSHQRFNPESPAALAAAHFWSPEQLAGQAFDHRSDIYSLGVVLFVLLTDQAPHTGGSLAELAAVEAQTSQNQLPEHMAAFQPIINRLLSRDPQTRYQKASDCITDLGALPKSAILSAVEGFANSLVLEGETPLETMAKVVPFSAYEVSEPETTKPGEPSELFDVEGADTTRIQPRAQAQPLIQPQSSPPLRAPMQPPAEEMGGDGNRRSIVGVPVIILALALILFLVLLYQAFFGKSSVAPMNPTSTPDLNQPTRAQPALREKNPAAQEVMAGPALEEQARMLREALVQDFSLATDLVVIYRAALRGEDAREHAFARAGLSDLQRLFSERILASWHKKNVEEAYRERDLAERLFESEELTPELIQAFSTLEEE